MSNIRKLLVKKGMTAADLSDKTGLSRPHLSLIINNKQDVRLSTLKKIAKGLDMDISDLLKEVD